MFSFITPKPRRDRHTPRPQIDAKGARKRVAEPQAVSGSRGVGVSSSRRAGGSRLAADGW